MKPKTTGSDTQLGGHLVEDSQSISKRCVLFFLRARGEDLNFNKKWMRDENRSL